MLNLFIIDKITVFTSIPASEIDEYRLRVQYLNNRLLAGTAISLRVTVKYGKLWLEFCPAKVWDYNHNLCGIGLHRLKIAIEMIQRVIDKNFEGLRLSPVTDWKLSQIHLTTNIQTDHIFSTYIEVFESIQPRYNLIYTCIDNSSVYFQSKKRDNTKSNRFIIRIYDKTKELKQRQKLDISEVEVFRDLNADRLKISPRSTFSFYLNFAGSGENRNAVLSSGNVRIKSGKCKVDLTDINIMRFEIALNKTDQVKNKLGVTNLCDILTPEKFSDMNDRRINILKSYLFYRDIKLDNSFNSLDDIAFADYLKRNGKSNAVLLLALMQSSERINYKYLQDVLLKAGYTEQNIKKQFDNIKMLQKIYRDDLKPNDEFSGLYQEIYSKLFQP